MVTVTDAFSFDSELRKLHSITKYSDAFLFDSELRTREKYMKHELLRTITNNETPAP